MTRRTLSLFLALLACGGAAHAQDHHDRYRRDRYDRYDSRYYHNHYYPAFGYSVAVLPNGYVSMGYRGGQYFYQGGVWFQRRGPAFVVVRPPVGILVPALPPDSTVVRIGGVPYYYANDTYYIERQGGYAVAQAPDGVAQVNPAAPGAPAQPYAAQPYAGQPYAGQPGAAPPAPPPAAPAAGAPAQAPGTWYYCDSQRGYYPYIQNCAEGFRAVPAALPPQR